MSLLETFGSSDFGDLSVWRDGTGSDYFRAIDVCSALRHSNPAQAIKRHVDPDYVVSVNDGSRGGKSVNYLKEPGLYQLIFASKTALAKKFQRWVFEEVLPKLRASGGYIMPSATSDQIQGLQKELAAMARRAGTLAIANQGYHLYDQVAYYFSCQEIIPRDQRSKLQRAFINWARQTKGVWIGKSVTYASGVPSLLDQKADWLISALLEFWRIREDWDRILMTADYYGLV